MQFQDRESTASTNGHDLGHCPMHTKLAAKEQGPKQRRSATDSQESEPAAPAVITGPLSPRQEGSNWRERPASRADRLEEEREGREEAALSGGTVSIAAAGSMTGAPHAGNVCPAPGAPGMLAGPRLCGQRESARLCTLNTKIVPFYCVVLFTQRTM